MKVEARMREKVSENEREEVSKRERRERLHFVKRERISSSNERTFLPCHHPMKGSNEQKKKKGTEF